MDLTTGGATFAATGQAHGAGYVAPGERSGPAVTYVRRGAPVRLMSPTSSSDPCGVAADTKDPDHAEQESPGEAVDCDDQRGCAHLGSCLSCAGDQLEEEEPSSPLWSGPDGGVVGGVAFSRPAVGFLLDWILDDTSQVSRAIGLGTTSSASPARIIISSASMSVGKPARPDSREAPRQATRASARAVRTASRSEHTERCTPAPTKAARRASKPPPVRNRS
mmetsp:Transcript_65931/g.169698  ORF Transcript_65931/g.169698 Transcript_65931/m.169698 type:complete len:221 (+) Transcript_65931:204-866(+)